MSEYQFGQFAPEHLDKIKKGIQLFNTQFYWECHEELEHHWLEDANDPARNVYWAVIQVAASCLHYSRENLAGAKGLMNKAKQKIDRCENMHVETPLLYEHLDWKEFKKLIREIPDEPKLEDFAKIYEFRFKDERWA